jgi:hypothetical protein
MIQSMRSVDEDKMKMRFARDKLIIGVHKDKQILTPHCEQHNPAAHVIEGPHCPVAAGQLLGATPAVVAVVVVVVAVVEVVVVVVAGVGTATVGLSVGFAVAKVVVVVAAVVVVVVVAAVVVVVAGVGAGPPVHGPFWQQVPQ